MFCAIQPEELSSCKWNKKNKREIAPNIVAFITRFRAQSRSGSLFAKVQSCVFLDRARDLEARGSEVQDGHLGTLHQGGHDFHCELGDSI